MRPQDVLSEAKRAVHISLDDSAHTLCTEHADVREGAAYEVETPDGWHCSLRGVHCAKCAAFLGVSLESMERRDSTRSASERRETLDMLSDFWHQSRGVRLSSPATQWLEGARAAARRAARAADSTDAAPNSPPAATAPPSEPSLPPPALVAPMPLPAPGITAAPEAAAEAEAHTDVSDPLALEPAHEPAAEAAAESATESAAESASESEPAVGPATGTAPSEAPSEAEPPVSVGQIYLGIRYLRVVDALRERPVASIVPILCKGCDRTLSYTDQLLCTRRRWGFGRNSPEPACFVNSVVRAHVEVRGRYEETLAQGLMDMSDVYCKCGKQVGYMFREDKTPNQRNLNQVGRMGLVCSTFRVATYQLMPPHAKVHGGS